MSKCRTNSQIKQFFSEFDINGTKTSVENTESRVLITGLTDEDTMMTANKLVDYEVSTGSNEHEKTL